MNAGQCMAVGQAGQGVVLGQVGNDFLTVLAVGNVQQIAVILADLALCIADDVREIVKPVPVAIFQAQAVFLLLAVWAVEAVMADFTANALQVIGMDQAGKADAPAEEVLGRIAGLI